MVLGHELDHAARHFLKQREVLHQVQQPRRSQAPRNIVSSDTLPGSPSLLIFFHHEVLPCRGHAAHPAWLPLDRMISPLYQKSCGMVSL